MTSSYKTCSKCGTTKATNEFNRNASRTDGYEHRCKQCRAEYRRLNQERSSEYHRDYRERNCERIKERLTHWRSDNQEHVKEYRRANFERRRDYLRQWRNANPEHVRAERVRNAQPRSEQHKRRRAESPERYAKYHRKTYLNNREHYLAYGRAWKQSHPDKVVTYQHTRRARLRAAEGSHTEQEWLQVVWRQGFVCAHCGEVKPLTRDHIVPLSKGGSNYISNIQGLCGSCNSSKGAKVPQEKSAS